MSSSKFSFLGHPLHPPFTHFPVALWSISLLWDVLGLWQGEVMWWQLSFWSITAGLVMALPAAVTGFIEYVTLPPERKETLRTATRHMIVVMVAASAYTGSLIFRGGASVPADDTLLPAMGLAVLGFISLQIGGWLGGELVYKHRVGVVAEKQRKERDRGLS